MITDYLFTSESVTEGHPDKMADQISDAVLDAVLKKDKAGRVACETLLKTGYVMIAGEITTKASDGRALVARLLALTTADDIEREVRTEMVRRFPGLLGEDAVLGPVPG